MRWSHRSPLPTSPHFAGGGEKPSPVDDGGGSGWGTDATASPHTNDRSP